MHDKRDTSVPSSMRHWGRGLDGRCYGRLRGQGRLGEYPPLERALRPEFLEDVRFLLESGESPEVAAARLGVSVRTLRVYADRVEDESFPTPQESSMLDEDELARLDPHRRWRMLPGRNLLVGAQRRMHALMRIGHPLNSVFRASGISRNHGYVIAQGKHPTGGVRFESVCPLFELYEVWQYQQGPSPRVAREARARGYLPPAAWAPEEINDPFATPSWPYRSQNGRSA